MKAKMAVGVKAEVVVKVEPVTHLRPTYGHLHPRRHPRVLIIDMTPKARHYDDNGVPWTPMDVTYGRMGMSPETSDEESDETSAGPGDDPDDDDDWDSGNGASLHVSDESPSPLRLATPPRMAAPYRLARAFFVYSTPPRRVYARLNSMYRPMLSTLTPVKGYNVEWS